MIRPMSKRRLQLFGVQRQEQCKCCVHLIGLVGVGDTTTNKTGMQVTLGAIPSAASNNLRSSSAPSPGGNECVLVIALIIFRSKSSKVSRPMSGSVMRVKNPTPDTTH